MATRNAIKLPGRPEKSTDFQLYSTAAAGSNVIDLTEKKLLRCAVQTKDLQQQMLLYAMHDDYVNGHIAVSWRRGVPIYVRVIKESSA